MDGTAAHGSEDRDEASDCDSPREDLEKCDARHNAQNESAGTTSRAITQNFLLTGCLLVFLKKTRRMGPIHISRAGKRAYTGAIPPHNHEQTVRQIASRRSAEKTGLFSREFPPQSVQTEFSWT